MNLQQPNRHWIVFVTILAALLLSILPMPIWLSIARPAWVAMVVMYWIMALPERFGLFFAFFVGLVMDVLLGTIFGQNSIGLLLVAIIVLSLHRRLRMFPCWQQTFMAFIIVGCYQLVNLWIRSMLGKTASSLCYYFIPALTSATFWPLISAILRFVKRNLQVT